MCFERHIEECKIYFLKIAQSVDGDEYLKPLYCWNTFRSYFERL